MNERDETTAPPDPVSPPLLSMRSVEITYRGSQGAVPAVRGVDFDVATGETVGLAGESGCGKSTLAMSILRLLPPTASVTGAIELGGENVLAAKPGRLRAVRWSSAAVVFQGAQHVLNPVQRIGHQIDEAIEAHGPRRPERAAGLLELVGLPGRRATAYPHELSGGQRQRALIAMALACDPLLLIADEPTTALDVMVQAQVLELLATIRRERGLSMLLISHDLAVLGAVADRVVVMYAGRIVEQGPAAGVLNAGAHPYTAGLAGAFPVIGDPASRHRPRGLAGDPPDPVSLPPGCPFHPRCDRADATCSTTDVGLRPLGAGRAVACLHPRIADA